MKYCNRERDKATWNTVVLGGIVTDVEEHTITMQYENLARPQMGWYYKNISLYHPTENDSLIAVRLPNGTEPPLIGSLVTVYGVIITDHQSKATIMAESMEDVSNNYTSNLDKLQE